MRVRATVNLPGNSAKDRPFQVGSYRDVNSRDPYIQRMLNAGYLVQDEARRRKKAGDR